MSKQLSKWERKSINWKIPEHKPVITTDPNLMTISEVANLLRVSTLTLKRWGKLGHIKEIRINSRGDRRYLRSEINKLLNKEVV